MNTNGDEPSSEKPAAKPKISKVTIYEFYLRAIMGEPPFRWGKFPYTVRVMREDGINVFIKIEDGDLCSVLRPEHLAEEIHRYIRNHLLGWDAAHLQERDIKQLLAYVKANLPVIENIAPVRFLDEPGYCFVRLPFPSGVTGETPCLDKIGAHTSNWQALMAFVGSLFFAESDMQTYVWCHGDGMNGKGAVMSVLEKAFGPSFRALEEWGREGPSKFWTTQLVGARVGVFDDVNRGDFVGHGLWKKLTGNAPITVEYKFGQSFTTRHKCKMFITSQEKPAVKSIKADLRRLIVCHFGLQVAANEVDGQFYEKCWQEAGAWFTKCIEIYRTLCPTHKAIPFDQGEAEDIAIGNESHIDGLIESMFTIDHRVSSTRALIAKVMQNQIKDAKTRSAVKSALQSSKYRAMGVKLSSDRVDGKLRAIWRGIKPLLLFNERDEVFEDKPVRAVDW